MSFARSLGGGEPESLHQIFSIVKPTRKAVLGIAHPSDRPEAIPFPLDASLRRERIYATVDSIPRGCVSTYGWIAREAGLPRGARQVGAALGALPHGRELPWHRVINSTGRISHGDPLRARLQRDRLEAEGICFSESGRVDLRRWGWPEQP